MQVSELIERLGGAQAVGAQLGLKKSAVPMWIHRGVIPAEHLLALWDMALAAGVEWTPPGAEALRDRLAVQPEAKVA